MSEWTIEDKPQPFLKLKCNLADGILRIESYDNTRDALYVSAFLAGTLIGATVETGNVAEAKRQLVPAVRAKLAAAMAALDRVEKASKEADAC